MVVLKQHFQPEKPIQNNTQPHLSFWKSVHSVVISRHDVLLKLRSLEGLKKKKRRRGRKRRKKEKKKKRKDK